MIDCRNVIDNSIYLKGFVLLLFVLEQIEYDKMERVVSCGTFRGSNLGGKNGYKVVV